MTAVLPLPSCRYGNIGRFLNHSCEPNLTKQAVLVDSQDLRMPHLVSEFHKGVQGTNAGHQCRAPMHGCLVWMSKIISVEFILWGQGIMKQLGLQNMAGALA